MLAMRKKVILAIFLLGTVATTWAARPLQVSITPDAALFDRNETIRGLVLNLWGENNQKALALGLVNGSFGESAGISLGIFANYSEHYRGLHLASVNYSSGEFSGWQAGVYNSADQLHGLQSGVVNLTGHLRGLQVGIFNYARDADGGLQIGLVNVIASNDEWFSDLPEGLAPGMILVNWRF